MTFTQAASIPEFWYGLSAIALAVGTLAFVVITIYEIVSEGRA